DTVVAIWTATRGHLTEVGCNDDTDTYQSETFADVTAGTTYWIEVAGYDEWSHGRLLLKVWMAPPLANDDFDAAIAITSTPYTASQYTYGATTAGDDPALPDDCQAYDSAQGYHSVWYQFHAPTLGTLHIDAG